MDHVIDHPLKRLYRQIQNGELSPQAGAEQIRRLLAQSGTPGAPQGVSHETPIAAALCQAVAGLLGVGAEHIDASAGLEEYGMDAVALGVLAERLTQSFGVELSPALIAEQRSLARLAGYIVDAKRMEDGLPAGASLAAAASAGPGGAGADEARLQAKTAQFVKKLLASVLEAPVERLDADAPLEQYGIDSVMVMKLNGQLEKALGPLPKTLFFEYPTIRELGAYLLGAHREKMLELLGLSAAESSSGGSATLEPSAQPAARQSQEQRQPDQGEPPGQQRQPDLAQIRSSAAPAHTQPEVVQECHMEQNPPDVISSQHETPSRRPAARKRSVGVEDIADGGIAIVGLAGRYPGASTLQQFWSNLQAGVDSVTEIGADRWNHSLIFDEDRHKPGKTNSKWGGFIEGADRFDPLFFQISPREAEMLDPQERLFLECVYETLEDAGYTRETLRAGREERGDVGVFVGVMYEEYSLYGAQQQLQGNPLALGSNSASIANRISYYFNFSGPSLTVNTMCSSSLTSLHLACQSIQRGECGLAIAGGVNLSLHPNKYLLLGQGNFASSKGRCESFGAGGDGYVPAEGVGAVLLKPLAQAIADRDVIYGVVKATAINHGGKTNGYTVPNPKAQAEVIRRALQQAGVHPRTISYIEAHGTGTSLGDPIEVAGLTQAFADETADRQFCALGAVKSNIGHAESAAGIAGLTKILLQMRHGQLAPSLHAETLNPHIDFSQTPFAVQRQLAEWKRPVLCLAGDDREREYPRRAGLSAFGAGGSNAHIIIEEYAGPQAGRSKGQPAAWRQPAAVVLSAKQPEALSALAQKLLDAVVERELTDGDLPSVAFTLQTGREAMEERLAFTAASIVELKGKLETFLRGDAGGESFYRGSASAGKGIWSALTADGAMEALQREWLRQRDFERVLELWVKGFTVDWRLLYEEGETPYRISLPTYPFARDVIWFPAAASEGQPLSGPAASYPAIDAGAQPEAAAAQDLAGSKQGAEPGMYVPVWEELPVSDEAGLRQPNTLLIAYPASAAAMKQTIVSRFRELGPEHARIVSLQLDGSGRAEETADDEWRCGYDDPQHVSACLSQYAEIDGLIFLSEFRDPGKPGDAGDLADSGRRLELQLLRVLRQLKERQSSVSQTDCYIVTHDNYAVGGEPTHPYGGGLTGLAYAAAQGDRSLRLRNIDLSSADLADEAGRRAALELILREPASPRGDVVKLHGGKRYGQQFVEAAVGDGPSRPLPWRPNGVYVIAGGSGTVGQAVTRHLIKTSGARVVWLGRSREDDHAVQAKLADFRSWGQAPDYVQADVTDPFQLERAVELIKRRHGEIHGAMFSGVVFSFENSVQHTTDEQFLDILNVKTAGAVHFYQAFEREPLDFMCYFSSGQAFAFSGAAQFAAYAAGITFCDAFVRSKRARSPFPVGTINWGFWKSSVQGTFLDEQTSSMEDEAGCIALARFCGLLRQGALEQCAILQMSPALRERMPIVPQRAVPVESASAPVLGSLLKRLVPRSYAGGAAPADAAARMEAWTAKLLFVQLNSLHPLPRAQAMPKSDWLRQSGMLAKYEAWLDEALRLLAKHGWVRLERENLLAAPAAETVGADCWPDWHTFKSAYLALPDWQAQTLLLDACLERLPDVLTGRVPATEVLFSNAGMDRVEGIYKNNTVADYFNNVLADALEAYVKERLARDPKASIRIIEAGAGTGGTSAVVLERLRAWGGQLTYSYTDISQSFLWFAQNKYGPRHPHVSFELWDVSQPVSPAEAKFAAYDVAIATNVLHATPNIRQTLRHVKAALKQNGVLLLNELTQKSAFATLTFGLLDGWWAFEDAGVRLEGSPLLAPDAWKEALAAEGFREVAFPALSGGELGQQVIAAESDGWVWLALPENERAGSGVSAAVSRTAVMAAPAQGGPDANERTAPAAAAPANETTAASARQASAASGGALSGASAVSFVKKTLLEQLSKVLKVPVERISPAEPFAEYGVDSILGVAFVNEVNALFGIKLNSAILFDYTSVHLLAGHLASAYPDALARLAGAAEPQIAVSAGAGEPAAAQRTGEFAQAAWAAGERRVEPASAEPLRGLQEPGYESVQTAQASTSTSTSRTASLRNAAAGESGPDDQAIAVIGIAGQFPDAPDVDAFWRGLAEGHDSVHELPDAYLDQSRYYAPQKQPGRTYCKWGGVLEEKLAFDPLFFTISPREAASMSPHQRLILQESWKALEDAGYNPKQLAGMPVGVFIGAEPANYFHESFTGSSEAIVASRLSYYLNLQGPALVVNTGCSSSAAAIHLACESLRSGESTLAIAGGVFAKLDTTSLVALSGIEMISPTGRCLTFDEQADGTVMSEGVGIVVLKPLKMAEADGDPIYGVIAGSGMNQDGASNGITAPNGLAQEKLLTGVYRKYGIRPEEITYIEAHGTGTRLGDPVETNALIRAFRQFTDDDGYCAIGSAKSNIGHTGAAAGVAGLIKVLLALRHRRIPGQIHFKKLNPLIELAGSPFYIHTGTQPWSPRSNEPLTAAINSFGHSGTNVHLVVREYVDSRKRSGAVPYGPLLVPLSARKEERLRAYAQKLLEFLERRSLAGNGDQHGTGGEPDLPSLAYTLQTGREALQERVVFLVNDETELKTALRRFLAGDGGDRMWRGQAKKAASASRLFGDDEEEQREAVSRWAAKGKLGQIAAAWADGMDICWELLYGSEKPLRMHAPTYPFAKDRYGMPERKREEPPQATDDTAGPFKSRHPLVQRNTSDLSGLSFSSAFTGSERFFRDHLVNGQPLLPGVAYLEMAREAVALVAGSTDREGSAVRLRGVVWSKPTVADGRTVEARIALKPQANGEIAYEIYSGTSGAAELCHRGTALRGAEERAPQLDLAALQNACGHSVLTGEACYEAFRKVGLEYGVSHRCIRELRTGADQALARLELHDEAASELAAFTLHPGLLDAALQAALGLMAGGDAPLKPAIPFALKELVVYGRCEKVMWSRVAYSDGSGPEDKVQKLDLLLCDGTGRVCVKMSGLSLRVLEGDADRFKITAPALDPVDAAVHDAATGFAAAAAVVPDTLLLCPVWQERSADGAGTASPQAPVYAKRYVMLCGFEEAEATYAGAQLSGWATCQIAQTGETAAAPRYADYAEQLLETLQTIAHENKTNSVLLQLVVPGEGAAGQLEGLAGMLKTARLEHPQVVGQLIEIDSLEGLHARLAADSAWPHDAHIRYGRGLRLVAGWAELEEGPGTIDTPVSEGRLQAEPWRDGGVYVVTGGAGGLGLLFAEEIVSRATNAVVVLTGRSAQPEAAARAKLEELQQRSGSGSIVYACADVADPTAVSRLVERIVREHGALHGVIHSAGVLADDRIRNKTREQLAEVFAPKVYGTAHLDEATRHLALDFFIAFSSGSAAWGSAGQADYAAANAFMDSYVRMRSALAAAGQRKGRSLTVNWPYWQSGGMRVDAAAVERMGVQLGLAPMPAASGIAAFYKAWASGSEQVLVMAGEPERIKRKLLADPYERAADAAGIRAEQAPAAASSGPGADERLRERVQSALLSVVSELIHVPLEELDADSGLDEYGFDSIAFSELANTLNRRYGLDLMPTLFFEYTTLHELAGYLSGAYRELLGPQLLADADADAMTAMAKPAQHAENLPLTAGSPEELHTAATRIQKEAEPPYQAAEPIYPAAERASNETPARVAQSPSGLPESVGPSPKPDGGIAIVGMSGMFPQAPDVEQFWQNLLEGRDCISEIPADRWDWREYYGDPAKEANKTNIKWGGFIEGVDEFDPLFFGISPRQAELMDPQQRLMMTCMWQTLEDAGYSAQKLSGTKTGIFVGTGFSGYGGLITKANAALEGYSATGMATAMGPNRMSYFLNVHGPSEPVDTACSSSLVAIDRAVNAIRSGYCDTALAGGVNTILTPELHISFNKANMLSEDGRSKAFSAQANGYARGEGVGFVYLKRLEDAEADGDHIYGVIRGTAVNHGGRANSLTAPNPKSQAELLLAAYRQAGIDPRTVTYIEAHGTGTELGDPIEINGLKTAFAQLYREAAAAGVPAPQGPETGRCGLGSVKSNIGHLELASGIAGVIKLLLQFKHKTLVKSVHTDVINPYIQLQDSPFYIVRENREWTAMRDAGGRAIPRRAGVSSFGFGGSNAHLVVEEYVPAPAGPGERVRSEADRPALIVLSAKDQSRLAERARQLREAIGSGRLSGMALSDIAYTLQVGRDAMEERFACLASSLAELGDKLDAYVNGKPESAGVFTGRAEQVKGPAALHADEDFQSTLEQWLSKGKYAKLLALWVQGMSFDWSRLYEQGGSKPKRVSLPGYPFARERYWVSGPSSSGGHGHGNGQSPDLMKQTAAAEKKILLKDWRENPLPELVGGLDGIVVVIGTTSTSVVADCLSCSGTGLQIVQVLHDAVRSRDAEGTAGTSAYFCDFYDAAEGTELYERMRAVFERADFLGVVDVTAYDEQYERSCEPEAGKIALLQRLLDGHRQAGWSLVQATRRLQAWQNDQPTLQGARLAGLYRMLGAEYPQIRAVTADNDCGLEAADELAVQLLRELAAARSHDDATEVIYRGGVRFTPFYKAGDARSAAADIRYDERDVVLITGGTGGIGAAVAEHVASQGAKRLVLLGREPLPELGPWFAGDGAAAPERQPVSAADAKLRRLQALADQGVVVRYASISLSDGAGLAALVAEVRRELGPVTCVFHCAGSTGGSPAFIRRTPQETAAVCEPKMRGLQLLHEALAEEPLRFFALFSSVASASPLLAAGQADYAMANAYMDFYAAHQAGAGRPYFRAVQWPAWAATGMAAAGIHTPAYAASGLLAHSPADGLALLDRALAQPQPVTLACVVDAQRFDAGALLRLPARASAGVPSPQPQSQPESKATAGSGAPDAAVSGLRPDVLAWLRQVLQAELKLSAERLEEHKPFADYGVDSILIAQIVQTLQASVSGKLPPSLLLEYGTLGALADYFVERHADDWQGPRTGAFASSSAPGRDVADAQRAGHPAAGAGPATAASTAATAPAAADAQPAAAPSGRAAAPQPEQEAIAVVGIACRFPDAPSKEGFWELLTQGQSAIRPVPDHRWTREGRVDYGGWLDDSDRFDPDFFHLQEADAAVMDPQARVLLEESLKAVCDAGLDYRQLRGQRIGVYVGGRAQQAAPVEQVLQSANPILGIGQNYLAANVSRFFDFRGPSMVVDTACSSGITGLMFASDSLRAGRIDMALVGAVSLLPGPFAHDVFAARNILSESGRFELFDKTSAGEVLGEGVGVIAVKRLSDAIRDGSRIYGVISGLAVNNDGRTLGPGSPNLQAQKMVMAEALRQSGKQPHEVGYIEANGGGTPIIDSIEIKALDDVYALSDRALGSCRLGATKPNIGHLLLASGMAGLIRCLLSVHHGQVPPFLSAREPFEHYDFAGSRIRFNRETESWQPSPGEPRTAALNSFPDGGTNGHVIIEQFMPPAGYREQLAPLPVPQLNKRSLHAGPVRRVQPEEARRRERRPIRNVWGEIR